MYLEPTSSSSPLHGASAASSQAGQRVGLGRGPHIDPDADQGAYVSPPARVPAWVSANRAAAVVHFPTRPPWFIRQNGHWQLPLGPDALPLQMPDLAWDPTPDASGSRVMTVLATVRAAFENGHVLPLDQEWQRDGSVKLEYGISPPEHVHAMMTGAADRVPRQDAGPHLYVAIVHVDHGRPLSLEVAPRYEDDEPLFVEYPPDRPAAGAASVSTVGYLATEFSQQDLLGAVIQRHNPQDFTGPPLPSGASVDSQALTSESNKKGSIEEILQAVPKEGRSKAKHFEAILDADDQLPNEDKWRPARMQRAAGVDPSNAKEIAYFRAPDSPTTTKIRQYVESRVGTLGSASATTKYSIALDGNDEMPDGEKWNRRSMRKAAKISRSDATEVEDRRRSPSPDTIAVREFVRATGAETATEKFRRAHLHNQSQPIDEQWHDRSIERGVELNRHAAGRIRRQLAPESQGTSKARELLAQINASNPNLSKSEQYRQLHALNATREGPDHLDVFELQMAVGMDSSNAAKALKKR